LIAMRVLGPLGVVTLLLCLIALVALLSGPAAASGGVRAAAAYAKCKGSYTISGSPSKSNPFYRRIRARRTSCPLARAVVQSWIASSYARSPSRVAYDTRGRRWGCSARFRRVGQVGQYQTVKCSRRGGRRVRFRGQP
jgi:hypothetical protein